MLIEQFQEIYKTLLAISTHATTFESEKKLVKSAQDALATTDIKQMWQALIDIALRQGFHAGEQSIINLAQTAIKRLLLQMQLLDDR